LTYLRIYEFRGDQSLNSSIRKFVNLNNGLVRVIEKLEG